MANPFTESLLRDVDQETLSDVLKLYAHDRHAQERQELHLRQAVGRQNDAGMAAVDGMGQVTANPTDEDYWAARVLHGQGAAVDPDFWRWFTHRPEGEYARVRYRPRVVTVRSSWSGARRTFRKTYHNSPSQA